MDDQKSTTIYAYDQYAQVYDDEVVEFWNNFPQTSLHAFVDRLPGRKVLNLGSGSGRDAVLLRDGGWDVVCVDGSAAMVEITKTLGFASEQMLFEDLQFEEASFDGIWAYTSLLHIPKTEVEKVLYKLEAALEPGGVLMVGMIEGEGEGMVERDSMPGATRFFRLYTADELQQLVESIGLEEVFEDRYKPSSKTYLHQVFVKGETA